MPKSKEIQKTESPARRFTNLVINEFKNLPGNLQLTNYQRELIQHLFIKIDDSLTDAEEKRIRDGHTKKLPYVWSNINLNKLAIKAVDRIAMGLDALVPNHIHVVFYSHYDKEGKVINYNAVLQIGYAGWDYIKRTIALNPPKNITYHLIHKNDAKGFKPIMKSSSNKIEGYEFEITEPFNRGPVIGGFGYIEYEDPTMNKLVLVSEENFKLSQAKSKTPGFWKDYPNQMRMSKLVIRTTSDKNIPIDPKKASLSYTRIREEAIMEEIEENANREVIDMPPEDIEMPSREELTIGIDNKNENIEEQSLTEDQTPDPSADVPLPNKNKAPF